MSKGRLIKALALTLTLAGCGGEPKTDEYKAADAELETAAQAEYATPDEFAAYEATSEEKAEAPFRVLLASAASDEFAAYETALKAYVKALFAAVPEEYRHYMVVRTHPVPDEYEFAAYEAALMERAAMAETTYETALEALAAAAPDKYAAVKKARVGEAYEAAQKELAAAAPNEWSAYKTARGKALTAQGEAGILRIQAGMHARIQAEILAAVEAAQKELAAAAPNEWSAYETALEGLAAAAPDEYAAYEKERANKVRWAEPEARLKDAQVDLSAEIQAELQEFAERTFEKARLALLAEATEAYAAYLTARVALEEEVPKAYAAYEKAWAAKVENKVTSKRMAEEAWAAVQKAVMAALVQDALPAQAAAAKAVAAQTELHEAAKVLASAPGVETALEAYEKALSAEAKALSEEAYLTELMALKASAPDKWAAVQKARAQASKTRAEYQKGVAYLKETAASEARAALKAVEKLLAQAAQARAAWHAAEAAYLKEAAADKR